MSWPDIVKSLRLKCGTKQDSLSLLVGVSQATISRWESGRQLPSGFYRQKLLGLYRHHVVTSAADFRKGQDGAGFLVHLDLQLRQLFVGAKSKCYNDQAVDEMLGRHPWETWLPANSRQRFETACREAVATGRDREFNHSGTISFLRTRVSWKPERRRIEVETRQVQCDAAGFEDDDYSVALAGCRSIGLVKADGEQIFGANNAFLNLIGWSRESFVAAGIRWAEITPPEFADLDRRALTDVRLRGEFEPYEKEYLHRCGGRVPVLLAGRAVQAKPLVIVATVIGLSRQSPTS